MEEASNGGELLSTTAGKEMVADPWRDGGETQTHFLQVRPLALSLPGKTGVLGLYEPGLSDQFCHFLTMSLSAVFLVPLGCISFPMSEGRQWVPSLGF